MNLFFKPNLIVLYLAFNIFLIAPCSAFTSSNNSNFYFRSAKKISGASSHDSQAPSIPSEWKPKSDTRDVPARTRRSQRTRANSAQYESDSTDDDDQDVEPGKMRISEIKAELDLREVSYKDCFDKESLVQRLQEARATGRANPKILEKFNKQKLEEVFDPDKKVDLKDEDIANAVANDGRLPGGLTPDQFKKLASNPEIMSLLQSTKMQEAMKLMMVGGREQLESKLKEDPSLQEELAKLDSILKGSMS